MNILVIEGSPHSRGSSNLLATNFIQGATEAGNKVEVIDVGHANLHPCIGCDFCGMDGSCSQRDDMAEFRVKILSTDMAVFVMPLYYFGIPAQMKMFIDRWYAFTTRLTSRELKTALICAAWDDENWTFKSLSLHYKTLCRYMHFKSLGEIYAGGCGNVSMTQESRWPKKAYEFGKSLCD